MARVWPQYMNVPWDGRLYAMQKSCNVGDVCKHFTSYFYHVGRGYCDGVGGDEVGNSRGPVIYGAVWLSMPTSYTSQPTYTSVNSLDVNSIFPTLYDYSSSTDSNGRSMTFIFNDNTHPSTSTTLWIGTWVPNYTDEWFGFIGNRKETWVCYGPAHPGGYKYHAAITMDYGTDGIGPGINQASIYITDWSPIMRANKSNAAYISWNAVSNQSSTVSQNINGSGISSNNTGDNSGTRYIKPTDCGVGNGSNFTFGVTRSNSLPSSASDSVKLYTYTYPTLDNFVYTSPAFTVQNNVINANHVLKLKWTSNSPVNDNKSTQPNSKKIGSKTTSDKHKTTLKIKGTQTSEVNTTSAGTTVQTTAEISSTSLMKYVPFNSAKTTGEEVDLVLQKSHTSDSDITVAKITKKLIVRYRPTEEISWPTGTGETGYRLIYKNGTQGPILQTNSVVDKDENNYIRVYFTYPKGEYGIIDGYRVRVISGSGSVLDKYIKTDRSNPELSPHIDILSTEIKYGTTNKVYISAYFEKDGQKYYGPEVTKQFPSVITRLSTPVITYPANNSEWINTKYRILMTLPIDGDWDDYTDNMRNSYIYRDIEVRVNGITYSYLKNPTIFSIENLSYKAQIAINPSLMSTYPNTTTYTLQVRVRKNYGYPDASEAQSWSLWSKETIVNVKTISFSVNKGDYILAAHFNILQPLMERMKNTYPAYKITTKKVNKGDYILAEDYEAPYKDIVNCYNTVNNWGKYSTNRSSVKFNNGTKLPTFESVVGEYVTALRKDKIYSESSGDYDGRNYIGIMVDTANLLE